MDKTIIALNNLSVRLRRTRCKPEELLVLFSRCLQRSACKHKLDETLQTIIAYERRRLTSQKYSS